MSRAEQIGEEIIRMIESGNSVDSVKVSLGLSTDEWYRFASKAYNIYLNRAKKKRKEDEFKAHVICTTNEQIDEILDLNNTLADYALLMPILSTMGDFKQLKILIDTLPSSESRIIELIGKITMHPKIRVMQKKGRIQKLEHFKIFTKLIDAATLSYYRTNFISCYLTLLPIVEGTIIRWMGYSETEIKPEFEEIRKFFKNSFLRQPCPGNALFFNIYIKACDKILNEHFYKPTANGNSYANFNRHVASHILNDNQFATKENCIRLFVLIDIMTEIYLYETKSIDHRFNLTNEEMADEVELLATTMIENCKKSPEHELLGTSFNDLI